MDTFLEVETPEELCRHMFLSFVKRHETRPQTIDGKAMKVRLDFSRYCSLREMKRFNVAIFIAPLNAFEMIRRKLMDNFKIKCIPVYMIKAILNISL